MKLIDELFKSIEEYRTKEELKDYIKLIYEEIASDCELSKLLQLKKGRFKELREELIPLTNYSYSKFAQNGSLYRIVLGNQKYDGIEFYNGVEYKIEFTEFHDGKEMNHLMKDMHSNNGVGRGKGRDFYISKAEFLDGFDKNARRKSENAYDNLKLVFIITNEAYGWILPHHSEEEFYMEIEDIIKKYDFGNNEVFIMRPSQVLLDESGNVITKVK